MASPLDCVVIGYNDTDFEGLLERHEPFQAISGGYRHLIANSVMIGGRRLKYFDVLNAARRSAGIRGDSLHVAKMPNLGVHYLVSFLRGQGLRAEYVNFFNDEKSHLRDLLEQRPNVVALTTTFYFESQPIRDVVDFIREHATDVRVVVGGPHVFNICTDHAIGAQDRIFDEMNADVYVFDSQGELTLSQLCHEVRSAHPNLSRVPNLVFRTSEGCYERSTRSIESNPMDSSAVNWRHFEADSLLPTIQTRTARSCAYKCAFCRYPLMAGGLDLMSLEAVERELDYLREIGVTYLLFIDDTFNIPQKRFKDLCRLMIRKDYRFKWFSYFRCANADRECFDLMSQAGCAGVFLGIESGDDAVLGAMNKVATVAKYRDGIRELNTRDIITHASFIVGYPSETEQSAANTLAFIDEAKPTFYCLETFFYDPKVPIAEKAARYGLTGRGYAWSHNTMDWRRASDIVEDGYRQLNDSIVLPLYSFDLWSLAYLLGRGFPLDQIKEFLSLTSRLLVDGLASSAPTPPAVDLSRLAAVFASADDTASSHRRAPASHA